MDSERKLALFQTLVDVGFKEIEVGFPSASQTDYDFQRLIIDEDIDPRRRRDPGAGAVPRGADRAHVRVAGRCPTGRRALLQLGVGVAAAGRVRSRQGRHRRHRGQGRRALQEVRAVASGTEIRYEYSPESFTGTEPEFAVEICEAVMDVMRADARAADDPQPAGHRRDVQPQRVRRRDRVVRPHHQEPRRRRAEPAPPQRPGHCGGCGRAGRARRSRPGRGHACSATGSGPATSTS